MQIAKSNNDTSCLLLDSARSDFYSKTNIFERIYNFLFCSEKIYIYTPKLAHNDPLNAKRVIIYHCGWVKKTIVCDAWKVQYKLNDKFKIQYKNSSLSRDEKLKEQDNKAYLKLRSLMSEKRIQNFAKKLAAKICEELTDDLQKEKLVENLNKSHDILKELCPILKNGKFNDFSDLIKFLNSEKNHIALLSVIWRIYQEKPRSNSIDASINTLYVDCIKPLKKYELDKKKKQQARERRTAQKESKRFGHSRAIKSSLFSHKIFMPFVRDIDFISIKKDPQEEKLKKYISGEKVFICGPSGMANMFCKVLNHMDIHPFSPEGKELCEIMAAFIVGSGMHSYEEVYYSFNLYGKFLLSQDSTGTT